MNAPESFGAAIIGILSKPRQRNVTRWFSILLIVLVASVNTWATYRFFTSLSPGGNDFLSRYVVFKAYFQDGLDPYSDQASELTNQIIYGHQPLPGEDENHLPYPFYSILLFGPFSFFPYALARALWMTLLQAAVLIGVLLSMYYLRWRPALGLMAIVFIWSLLDYIQARAILLGQVSIWGFLSLAAMLFLLKLKKDFLAGAVMVLSTVKPTLVFLLVPFLLLWAISRQRWAFLKGFLIVFLVVLVGSFLALPSWFAGFIYRVFHYSDYTVGQSPVWLLTHIAFPSLGGVAEIILSLSLVALMLLCWWRAFQPGNDHEFLWTIGVTLLVSNLIVPRSATTNYVMFLPIVLWFFAALSRSWKWSSPFIVGIMLISILGLWWLHLSTVVGDQEQAIMFLPTLLAIGLLLIAGRRWLLVDSQIFTSSEE